MAKSHDRAQALAKVLYQAARTGMLAGLKQHLDKLDALTEADSDAIKAAVRRILGKSGFSARRIERAVDDVFSGSRAARLDVLENAVRDAAKSARGLDQATFNAIFGGEPETPPPKAPRADASSPMRTPIMRLVGESGDDSTETN